MKLVCIKCPRGCEIDINGDDISGYSCPRGLEYAKTELTNPMRIVTYLCKCADGVISVKTDKEVPKSKINEVVEEISKLHLKDARIGDVVIKNVLSTGANIVVTGEKY